MFVAFLVVVCVYLFYNKYMQIKKFCKKCGESVLRDEKYKNRKTVCYFCKNKYKGTYEGDHLHGLLMKSLSSFYKWQDHASKKGFDNAFLKRTKALKELIEEVYQERLDKFNDQKNGKILTNIVQ